MDYSKLIDSLTPEVIERFKSAVETGKWPDGTALSEEQRDSCMQAIMLYQARHQQTDEPFTIDQAGQIRTGKKMRSEFEGLSTHDKLRLDADLLIDSKTKH